MEYLTWKGFNTKKQTVDNIIMDNIQHNTTFTSFVYNSDKRLSYKQFISSLRAKDEPKCVKSYRLGLNTHWYELN